MSQVLPPDPFYLDGDHIVGCGMRLHKMTGAVLPDGVAAFANTAYARGYLDGQEAALSKAMEAMRAGLGDAAKVLNETAVAP